MIIVSQTWCKFQINIYQKITSNIHSVHTLEPYGEDYHGPNERMAGKSMQRPCFSGIVKSKHYNVSYGYSSQYIKIQ